MAQCRLDHIVIAVSEPRAYDVYRAICGGEPATHAAADGTARYTRFYLDDAMVELAEPIGDLATGQGGDIARRMRRAGPGVHLVCLPLADLAERADALEAAGVQLVRNDDHVYVHPRCANGVLVQLTPRREHDVPQRPGDACLDHVAIRVRDLAAATQRWEAITGVRAHIMGIHPISGGTFTAARIELGERMIELISPVPGQSSPLAERLASHGEGVAAVALPARDIEATLARLRAAGARVLRQEPHWMVHPKDAAGVLVQLTPRVRHA
jgi:catechol 2,3-dioxygenase-like lactoylglutathione lyase family enzyme